MTRAKDSRRVRWTALSIRTALLCAVSLVAGAHPAPAGINVWTSNGPPGPFGVRVNAIAVDPDTPATVYAGTYAGVFKSTNSGGSWSAVNTGLTTTVGDVFIVNALAIDPTAPATVFAGTGDAGAAGGGVFKSTDGGDTWNAVNAGFANTSVLTLAIDPSLPSTLYAGTQFSGVFKSTDGGGTWSAINAGGLGGAVTALAIDPRAAQTLYAGTWVGAGSNPGVFKSTDGGDTWTAINAGLPSDPYGLGAVTALAIDPTMPYTLYAGMWWGSPSRGNVFKSTDGGGTWNSTGLTTASVMALAIDATAPDTLYAGTEHDGLFKTTDGGGTWSSTALAVARIHGVALGGAPLGTIYAGTEEGVFQSTDGGETWGKGIRSAGADVRALAIDPVALSTLYVGTAQGVFRSTDNGGRWDAATVGLADTSVNALVIDPSAPLALYAGTSRGMFKSIDRGATWNAAGLADTSVSALAIEPGNPPTIYAGTSGGVFKSTDRGATWSAAGLADSEFFALVLDSQTPATLYALTWGGMFKSTDGGGTWSNTGAGGRALAVDPQTHTTLYVGSGGCFFPAGCSGEVIKSTDGGSTWGSTGLNGPVVTALAIDRLDPRTLYAGTWGHSGINAGVFKSTDGGATWYTFSTAPPELRNVVVLAIDPVEPRRVYAGTSGSGVFAIEQAQVVGTGTPASCTEAELDAALAPGGLVTFNCGPAPVTITLTSEKAITAATTIDGGGLTTLSGGGAVRIFTVIEDATLDVRDLTIADGRGDFGGGIINFGTLTLTSCTLRDNSATGPGGGILNSGTLTLTSCTLADNATDGDDGDTSYGGGIANYSGTLTLTNCTLSGNSAASAGGGIANYVICDILCPDCGAVVVANSTFAANVAHGGAGAIYGRCPVSVTNSIIASSSGANCRTFGSPLPPAVIDGGHNLQFPGGDCGETIPSLDPLLDPAGLQDNGVPTQTIALLPGSPAINAGDPDVCANPPVNGVDQRGYARPGTGHTQCSIGAYEADAIPPEACTGDCDGNDRVAIHELVLGVNIVLGRQSVNACPAFASSQGTVDVAQLVTGVDNAMNGCGS